MIPARSKFTQTRMYEEEMCRDGIRNAHGKKERALKTLEVCSMLMVIDSLVEGCCELQSHEASHSNSSN